MHRTAQRGFCQATWRTPGFMSSMGSRPWVKWWLETTIRLGMACLSLFLWCVTSYVVSDIHDEPDADGQRMPEYSSVNA